MYIAHICMYSICIPTYLAIVVYLHEFAKPAAIVIPHCLSITK